MTAVRLGMTLAEAHAALAGAGVAFEERPSQLAFQAGGKRSELFFEDGVAHWLGTPEEPASPEDAIPMIQAQIAFRGPPYSVSHHFSPQGFEAFRWRWPRLSFAVSRRRSAPWRASVGDATKALIAPAESGDELRARIAQVRARLADVAPGVGARRWAILTWRETLERRTQALEDALRVFAATAPNAPIDTEGVDALTKHADWLARHHELFPRLDDHRDALVVTPRSRQAARYMFSDGHALGWTVEVAFEVDTHRMVQLLHGPFAYGIHRVFSTADERYPDPGDEGEVTLAGQPSPKMPRLRRVRGTIGPVTVEVEGFGGRVGRLAARLALARAQRGAR